MVKFDTVKFIGDQLSKCEEQGIIVLLPAVHLKGDFSMNMRVYSSVFVLALAGQASSAVLLEELDSNPQAVCGLEATDRLQIEQVLELPNLELLLDSALANCPEVAELLVAPSTATILQEVGKERADVNIAFLEASPQ